MTDNEGIYQLVGLSKPKTATLTGPKEDFFWATIEMPEDRVKALWEYCKGNWEEKKYARIKYKELSSDGFPIDAIMVELVLTPDPPNN